LKILARLYTGIADSKEDQLQLAHQFNEDWKLGNTLSQISTVLVPDNPFFGTVEKTFTDDEIKKFNNNGTIYLLVRFEYSDETGRWRTDACSSLQRETPTKIDKNIFHPCSVFQHFRYSVKQH
jgi:hypothetical protein